MKPMFVATLVVLAAGLSGAAAQAADAPPASRAPAATEASTLGDRVRSEPAVRRTVIEDDSVHIEELRVRGQLQKVTVESKGRAPDYEILVGDGSRDLSTGANTSRGAAGKRVWNVFRF